MDVKHIIVHLDNSRSALARYGVAISLAKEHDANLTGVYIKQSQPPPRMPGYSTPELPPEMLARINDSQQDEIQSEDDAASLFESAAREAGINTDTIIESVQHGDSNLAEALIRHARTADLVIMGKPDAHDPASPPRNLPHDVLFGSGGPVVVVPGSAREQAGQRVVVAWNGSREAARAVRDALPLLEHADEVTLLSVSRKSNEQGAPLSNRITEHLAKHGVSVKTATASQGGMSVENVILSRLTDSGGDFLIMGAYGHSRMREMILGGVTKRMLEHATVPIMLSR